MKRFVCFLLAMIMIMGMVPATAVTASAASNRTTSDSAVEILKEFEGYAQKSYQDGNGNWFIGYGTEIDSGSLYPNGISKDDAHTLLKNYLKKVDDALNTFTRKNNLDLEQYEHDALALLCYSIGYGWLETGTGPLRTAVLEGKGGNELINAFAQNAGTPDSDYFEGLMNRRLAEANMYLNNSYAFYAPDNFTYVILDMDGDRVADSTDKVIGYNSDIGRTLAETANKTGESFLGWYYEGRRHNPDALGYPVDYLDEETAGEMLIAKFSTSGSAAARYYIHTTYLDSRRVYEKTYTAAEYKANIAEERIGTLAEDSYFAVREEAIIDGLKWLRGYGEDRYGDDIEGWVVYGRLADADEDYQTPLATAKANQALKIYEGASTDSKEIGKLNAGTVVNLYSIKAEETETGNRSWGKIVNVKDANGNTVSGWINLVYTTVTEVTDDSDVTYEYGVIVNTNNVNVRSKPEVVNNPSNVITTLRNGTEVYVLDTYMNGANQWALVEWDVLKDGYTQGWVLMYYVEVDGYEHTSPDGSYDEDEEDAEPVLYTGVVNSPNMNLNVREFPSASTKKAYSLKHGTEINIYETATTNGVEWGRIGEGQWVCLQYVILSEVDNSDDDVVLDEGITTLQGTVTTATLNVLKNYNSNAEVVGTLEKGETITILERNTEITTTGSRIWGRIATEEFEGWVNLAYVDLKYVTTVTPGTDDSDDEVVNPTPAIISDCISANVRADAGVHSAQITKLNNGTAVTVYEQITYSNAPWARIKWNNGASEGWVCMYYVTLNAGTGSANTDSNGILNGTSSNAISATGFVNNAYLNVRAGAGLGFAQVGTLNQGARVTLFEQAVSDGLIWGRISYNNTPGWVCMSYITLENVSSTGKGVMGTVARCFAKANVRSAPGTNNALVSTVNVGSRVEVFEIKTHAAQQWGRIPQGWICMEYVLLDSELPEGTILDATTAPTTEATTAPTVDETVNKVGEVAFKIEAGVLTKINVYNDANAKSVRVGTISDGLGVDIVALKNNGAELWGRVDQYGTAGWICLSDGTATYAFKGYVNAEDAPVYVEANTSSAVKGTLPINKEMTFTKVTTDGDNVYGWVEENIYGWLPMSKISSNPIDVIPVLKSGESVGSGKFNPIILHGTTFAEMNAYDVIGGSKVLFKMKSGVNVNVTHIRFENGKIWARVEQPKKPGFPANWSAALDYALDSGEYSEYGEAWFDLSKVNYTLAGKVDGTVRVRSSMDDSTTESSTPNNIVSKVSGTISICQLGFDSYGNLWARITNNGNSQLNGMFVMVRSAAQGVDGYTVKNYGELYISTDLTPNEQETIEGSDAIESAEPAAAAEIAEAAEPAAASELEELPETEETTEGSEDAE